LIVLLTGCYTLHSPRYVQTGDTYSPLSEQDDIKLFLTGNIPEYEEIGVLRISTGKYFIILGAEGDYFDETVEEAKRIARREGGDCLILMQLETTSSVSGTSESVSVSTDYTYMFIIGRLID
jgi:hypothetical protein